MSTHAFLSPSASHRWLMCPPSARACEGERDTAGPAALEGTDAHELCAYLVEKALGHEVKDPTEDLDYYNPEMQEHAEEYCSFVLEEYQRAKESCSFADIFIETKVDYSRWVDGGTGTADCIIVSDGTAEIIDFKYGQGVLVDASSEEFGGNPQLMCYALGMVEMFDRIYDISEVKMVIFQPRRSNISCHTMTKDELIRWADEVLAPTAALAMKGEGEFKAGDHCIFCRAKATCRKRAEHNLAVARYDFRMPDRLTDTEIDAILLQADSLVSWINDIKEYALVQAMNGTDYGHFKVVEGRSNRKYTSDAAVAKIVSDAGYDPYEQKLLGVTAMTKMLGKKKFEELLSGLTCKPKGKPTLVSKDDKRPQYKDTAKNDFTEKEND